MVVSQAKSKEDWSTFSLWWGRKLLHFWWLFGSVALARIPLSRNVECHFSIRFRYCSLGSRLFLWILRLFKLYRFMKLAITCCFTIAFGSPVNSLVIFLALLSTFWSRFLEYFQQLPIQFLMFCCWSNLCQPLNFSICCSNNYFVFFHFPFTYLGFAYVKTAIDRNHFFWGFPFG